MRFMEQNRVGERLDLYREGEYSLQRRFMLRLSQAVPQVAESVPATPTPKRSVLRTFGNAARTACLATNCVVPVVCMRFMEQNRVGERLDLYREGEYSLQHRFMLRLSEHVPPVAESVTAIRYSPPQVAEASPSP